MKILYIVTRFHTNLYCRVKALQAAGHEVFVLAEATKSSERHDILEPIYLKPSSANKFFNPLRQVSTKIYLDWPNLGDLKKRINEIRPDVMIARNLRSLRSLFALWYARKIVPVSFVEMQTRNFWIEGRWQKAALRLAMQIFRIKGIISPLRNRFAKQEKFFHYLPFAVEAADFKKEHFKNGRVNIIAVGKFIVRKEHLLLLEAVKNLKDKYDLSVTFVGSTGSDKSYYDQVVKFIADNDLSSLVEIRLDMKNEDVLELYKEHDLFVLPAYDEPASYSVLEAMAAKLPVIASDTCGTSSYIDEGGNGFVFKSKDSGDLSAKIEEAIKDKEKLVKMGEKSFVKAKTDHSLEAYRRHLEDLSGKFL